MPSRAGFAPSSEDSAWSTRRRSLLEQPATTNPEPGDLTFKPADEARAVTERLDGYYTTPPESAARLDLRGSWRTAQASAREFLTAEEEYVLAAIRLLIARHGFDPRFFATSSASFTATGEDGRYAAPLRILNELGVTQRLADGGQVAARLVWDATEQLRESASGRYAQASSLVVSGTIPLLRGAGPSAREELVQSERDLVYAARTFESARRTLLVSIAADYFALVQQRAGIRNQEQRLEGLLGLEERVSALVDAGRVAEFQKNIASNQVLQARASLANQREAFQLALDRFKIRLGRPIEEPVAIDPIDFDVPEPETTPEAAAEAAVAYRLDLQTTRDRVDDARRAVENARNNTLPDLDLSGSIGSRTKPGRREGGFVYELDDMIYGGSVTFGLPLDRENERLALRTAIINLQRAHRELDERRDNVVVDARARVREIDRARFNLKLAEQAAYINKRRLEEQDLKRDEVTTQDIVDAQNDLLSAENARDQAATDLRNAILQYLLATAQLRVARDGTLQPLPGMEASAR